MVHTPVDQFQCVTMFSMRFNDIKLKFFLPKNKTNKIQIDNIICLVTFFSNAYTYNVLKKFIQTVKLTFFFIRWKLGFMYSMFWKTLCDIYLVVCWKWKLSVVIFTLYAYVALHQTSLYYSIFISYMFLKSQCTQRYKEKLFLWKLWSIKKY
jgi:hypothetical protein